MTLRNIELSVAVPKVTDVSRVQQLMQQQQGHDQALFAEQMARTVEKRQHAPEQTQGQEKLGDREPDTGRQPSQERKKDRDAASKQSEDAKHPFKGTHFDVSL